MRLMRTGDAADHARARGIAAERLGETLPDAELAWLLDHLAGCAACAAVAAEYDEQRVSLRGLRLGAPEPPRDLWARTAAAIETEGAGRARRRGWLSRGLPLAPVAALMVVAVAVGAGLLNGRGLFPDSTSKGDGPMPTPMNVAAAEVQVLSRGEDGTVRVLTRRLDQVCPIGADACGLSQTFDVTTTAGVMGSADLDGIISPGRDRMVVVDRGAGAGGVYVVDMNRASAAPAASPTPRPTRNPGATAQPATQDPPTASPTASPDTATPEPPATGGPDPSATATATPEPATAPPTEEPTPSIAVTPAPDGTLEIARDVIVVGGIAAYSNDGTRFAFTARPADGSVGPDVFLWTVGDTQARPVTSDHAAMFAGWLDGRLLVSRLRDGKPGTVLLDPSDGTETEVGEADAWRPAIGPNGDMAAWWDGTVELADDGVTPVPGAGRLVLARWPVGGAGAQVLATGPLSDWDVHWDAKGTVLAVWTSTAAPGQAGLLSLYAIDAGTGRADLDHPLIDATVAFDGFSLKTGRLAWASPAVGGDSTVQVVAWSGRDLGRLELPTEQGVTVVR